MTFKPKMEAGGFITIPHQVALSGLELGMLLPKPLPSKIGVSKVKSF